MEKQTKISNPASKWVVWIFIALLILNIIAVFSGFAQAQLLNKAIDGEIITPSEAISNDTREAIIGFTQFALYLASGIVFLIWIHKAHKNLLSLNVSNLRFTPGWAVGWFFVPVMSLFRPYQVVSEIWKASYPKADANTTYWKSIPTSPLVGWWWTLFIISNFVAQIALRLILTGEDLSDLLNSTYAYVVSDAIDVVGIMITILMVRRISQFQAAKNKLISSPQ